MPLLETIWSNAILTNGGPFHQQLEEELRHHLKVSQIALFSNGTLGLIVALQALRITGEVITTPYSFVATAHSLLWNGIQPVFVDVEPATLNLDPRKIEAAITPKTTAIMPVHCYGNPCDVSAIQEIADTYNLKVIYDAAHAFGVEQQGKSILNHGDLSVLSFHATKVFNTFEGGAIVCPDEKAKRRIDYLKNFGFADEVTIIGPGINAKMSEICAALGLLQLRHMPEIIEKRRAIDERYRSALEAIEGLTCLPRPIRGTPNCSYFPILVGKAFPRTRDALYDKLKRNQVFGRRYFYPLLSTFSMYRDLPSARPSNLPVATAAANEVLCLPIYPGLSVDDQDRVIDTLISRGDT
jgi:dTDP-4-amino-4,6-dideoxygalactose transaminase